jgi:hypothetical protein
VPLFAIKVEKNGVGWKNRRHRRDPTPAGQERPDLGAPVIADIARDRKTLKPTPIWDEFGMAWVKWFGILVERWGEGYQDRVIR